MAADSAGKGVSAGQDTWENIFSGTSKTSFMASWLADPPIQDPAMHARPFQVSLPIACKVKKRTELMRPVPFLWAAV